MSDFWLSKMRTYFQRIDFDKDGEITRKDFESMAQRFIDSGKLNKEHHEDLMKTLCSVWDTYLSAVGGGNSIKQDAFIEAMKKLVHDPKLKETLQGPLPLFFHAVDSNYDGLISKDEFVKFFEILGLDPALAPASFEAIDDNHDGNISLDEFKMAGTDFFMEEKDESKPSKLLWGPLL
jgi:Ca2+-binding EF-hand superfamily protein